MSLQKEKFYEIKTIFGSRDREIYEVYCRAIVELLNSDDIIKEIFKAKEIGKTSGSAFHNPFANKTVVLSLALKPTENEDDERKLLKKVLDSVKENIHMML